MSKEPEEQTIEDEVAEKAAAYAAENQAAEVDEVDEVAPAETPAEVDTESEEDTDTDDGAGDGADDESADESAEETADDQSGEDEPPVLTDEQRELARSYGLSDEKMDEYPSYEELSRALELFDQQFLAAGRKELADAQQETEVTKQPTAKPPKAAEPETVDSKVDWSEHDSEEQLVKNYKLIESELSSERARIDQLEAYLSSQIQQQDDERHQQLEDHFDSICDAMKDKRLGSKEEGLTPSDIDGRKRLWSECSVFDVGMRGQGLEFKLSDATVRRAYSSTFADELKKESAAAHKQRVSSRSKQRTRAGNRHKRNAKWAGAIEDDPEIKEAIAVMLEDPEARPLRM